MPITADLWLYMDRINENFVLIDLKYSQVFDRNTVVEMLSAGDIQVRTDATRATFRASSKPQCSRPLNCMSNRPSICFKLVFFKLKC
uniref:Uncharacterized protein n=1 Tax=Romanomermis culicivorax TaxID=13658 RepID=A0A915L278_ROMCU